VSGWREVEIYGTFIRLTGELEVMGAERLSDSINRFGAFVQVRNSRAEPLSTNYPVLSRLEPRVTIAKAGVILVCPLEEVPDGAPMSEVATRILASKSGLTRVIDNMVRAGLVRRERPEDDRRLVLVFITPDGLSTLEAPRRVHRDGIRRHFTAHLTEAELTKLARSLDKVREQVRPLRPGRVSG